MSTLNRYKLFFGFVSIILAVFAFLMGDDDVRKYLSVIFFIQFVAAVLVGQSYSDKLYYYFSPSFVGLSYVNLSFILGGYALYRQIGIAAYQYRSMNYLNLEHVNTAVGFSLLCSAFLIFAFRGEPGRCGFRQTFHRSVDGRSHKRIFVCLALIAVFSLIRVDLTIIGGKGDFSTIPKTIAALILFYEAARSKIRLRLLLYFLVIVIFTFSNFESKREVLFLLLPILFFESYSGNIQLFKISIKRIVGGVLSLVVISYLILVMTIARGFGNYRMDTPLSAVKYVPDIIVDYDLVSLLASASEASTTTYHSLKAITLVVARPDLMTYGSTYAKMLFIVLPTSVFGFKPLSMTAIFTKLENPIFYSNGGSLPINFFSEAYWNFSGFGLIFLFLLITVLNRVYRTLFFSVNQPRPFLFAALFGYTYLVGFFRGFGFDLFAVFIIIGLFFSWLFYWICYRYIG